jgi:hypothetical protein
MSVCELKGQYEDLETIRAAHTAATTAWTPVKSATLGILIPLTTQLINVANTFYRGGRFMFSIDDGVTVAQGNPVYYNTDTDKVCITAPTKGWLIGTAVEAGTATAGYVLVEILKYPNAAQISLEHLDSGIKPAYITVAAGTKTTEGGDATELITISGLLSTDKMTLALESVGATPVTVSKLSVADGVATLVLSGNPSTDHKFSYVVNRAAA